MKFRECVELLRGRRFSLQIKGNIYKKLCETSDVVWKRKVVLERIRNGDDKQRSMVRAMC